MTKTITSDEFIAEMLPQEVIDDADEMIIYISNETDGMSYEDAEGEYFQEEEEDKTAIFSRVSLIFRRGLLFLKKLLFKKSSLL